MDVLSEVLGVVKLKGALFFNAELSAPWCLTEPRGAEIASYLSPGAPHLILYHLVTEGRAYVGLPGGRRETLAAGDIVIFPHGDDHILGNGKYAKPVDAMKTFAKNLSDGLKLARYGGGGEVTRLVCGYMVCEPRLGEIFLSGLPKMLKIRISDEPAGKWLEESIRFSVGAGNGSDAGSGLVIAKLSEVLFVETLRRYINGLPPGQTGWLAGVRDPYVGQTLALIHGKPEYSWTIANLARRVGLSRTRLAERFRLFLEDSPMSYLKKWRLRLGAETLRSTNDSIAEIAAAVGYASESAFNRAFKREFDRPPAQFRRDQKADERAGASRPSGLSMV
jgi:AraC-like DNA-binding protein